MAKLPSNLNKVKTDKLFKDLNYLNIKEYQGFCKKHSIPFHIYIETERGLKKTPHADRKKFVLEKIRSYILTGKVPKPTVYSKKVICFEPIKSYSAKTKLHYGQYDKYDAKLISVMKELSDGQFKNGMIARLVTRDFWLEGKAPTLAQFAKAWLIANEQNTKNGKLHSEFAYLFDVSTNNYTSNWKKIRTQKAKEVLNILSQI